MIDNQTFRIRPIQECELQAVVALELSCGLSTGGAERFRKLLRTSNCLLIGAFKKETFSDCQIIVGMICGTIVLDEFQIDNLAVKEDFRRKGLGSTLVISGLRTSAGLGAVTAILEVRASNIAAQRLYEKCGFAVVGRRRDYYRDPNEDALTLSLRFESLKDLEAENSS